jgi:hypothetical protein
MSEHMSHQAYVSSCRAKAAEVAAAVLDGSIPILDACHLLDELAAGVDVPSDDHDFGIFSLIHSETDSLPIGRVRDHWAPDALARIEPDIQAAVVWANPIALPALQSVVARFGA